MANIIISSNSSKYLYSDGIRGKYKTGKYVFELALGIFTKSLPLMLSEFKSFILWNSEETLHMCLQRCH